MFYFCLLFDIITRWLNIRHAINLTSETDLQSEYMVSRSITFFLNLDIKTGFQIVNET